MGGQFAWVTLATNDSYSLGALVLAHSLRRAGTKHDLAVLITPGVTQVMRDKLATVFNLVKEVNVLDSKDEANLALLARPELGITFTKLHCWRLTEYEKCVFVDADALVIRNCDELFEREELTAAPDVGWPDCFNSGVFVFKPSQQTFASITAFAAEKGSFDGGDQGLLNSYFSDWAHKDIAKHLPFIYNMCSTATYSYLPAYKQFGENVRIIHFIGATKPWLQYFDTETGIVHPPSGCSHLQPLLQIWWNIFCDNVHPQLSPVMARSTLAPIWHRFTPLFSATSATSHAPIYDDSSHGMQHQHSYSYRSEIRNFHNDESQGYYYSEYSDKPADFSEFHDPWDEYVAPPPPPVHNQQFSDHFLHYQKEPESSPPDQQYYDNLTRHVDHREQINWQHQFSNHERESTASVFIRDQDNLEREKNTQEDRNENYWRHDNPCDKESLVDCRSELIIGEKERFDDRNESRNVNENCNQTVNEAFVQYQTTTNYSTDDDHRRNEDYQGFDSRRFEDQERNLPSQNFALGQDSYSNTDNHQAEARDESNLSQSNFTPSPELNCTAHSTPMHDLVRHNEQSVENQGHLAIDEAGIAGALAKMTLGEPRSSEQIAFEEHMRRQGWEQGQIDYMGRDSFENIWKKICNTLSQPPPREPSPPRDTEEAESGYPTAPASATEAEPAEITAEAVGTTEESSSVLPAENEPSETPIDVIERDAKPTESETSTVQDQPQLEQKAEAKLSELETEVEFEKTSVEKINVPEEIIPATKTEAETTTAAEETTITTPGKAETLEPVTTPSELKETLEPSLAQVSSQVEASVETVEEDSPVKPLSGEPVFEEKFISTFEGPPVQEKIAESVVAPEAEEVVLPVATPKAEEVVPPVATPKAEEVAPPVAAEVLAEPVISPIAIAEAPIESSELILDSSSVPIQVAESVLQSEPKESVSVEQSPVGEEAVSSIVAPVLESATAVSETVAEPGEKKEEENEKKYQNGGDEIDAVVTTVPATSATTATPVEFATPASAPVIPEPEPELATPVSAPVIPEPEPEAAIAPPPSREEVTAAEPEPPVAAAAEEAEVEAEASVSGEEPSESSKSASLTPPDSPSTTCPVRPARTRDPKIPTTPIVTEATPPNSPPIGALGSLDDAPKTVKKVVRKVVVKKSAAPGDGESAESVEGETPGKKVVKKVVKKIVKKPKEPAEEGAEASGAAEKPKKVVKVVKKIVKPTESLDVDASVPETPPAGTAVPVPPKRKTKTTTTTTTATTTTKVTKSPQADDGKPSESEP